MENPEGGVSGIYSGDGEDELMIALWAGSVHGRDFATRNSSIDRTRTYIIILINPIFLAFGGVDKMGIKEFSERWLVNGIEEDYKNWQPRGVVSHQKASRIFIESPTGTGKSSFVLDKLFPFAAEKNYNILYLANRSALNQQIRNAVARKLKVKEKIKKDEATFYLPESFCCLTVINYQAISLDSTALETFLSDYAYIVFDEAHFFVEDSLFNAKTGLLLKSVLDASPDAVWIFLSATLDGSEELLLAAADKIQPNNLIDANLNKLVFRDHYIVYKNNYQSAVYTPSFFRSIDDLMPVINRTVGEKWLIFVSSIQRGKALQQRIKKETGRKAVFLSSENKAGKRWEMLSAEERYDEDVLIATKVLDNGVNIRDEDVRHIVIPFCDRTEFMQMLGRRRTHEGERVCLYVEVPTIQKINTLRHGVETKRKAINGVNGCAPNKKKALLAKMWEAGRKDINSLFYINKDGNLTSNFLAEEKLKQLSDFYGMLAAHYKEGACYEKTVLTWIKMEDSEPVYLGQTASEDIIGFLSRWEGEKIQMVEWENFYREFERLYNQECRNRFPIDSAEYQKAVSVRKAPPRRKSTVNRQMQILGLPYKLNKENNCWVLHKQK